MNEIAKVREVEFDDFIVVSNFHELPQDIVFYYNISHNSRPYIKVNKTHCWDGSDKLRATNPSCLNHVVRVPRPVYESYCFSTKNTGHLSNSNELLQLVKQHQYKVI